MLVSFHFLGRQQYWYFDEVREVIHQQEVCPPVKTEQVGFENLPWSFWNCRGYHWFPVGFLMLNTFVTVSDHLFQLFAQTWPTNRFPGSATTFDNSLMPIVNPVQDFQSNRWRNNETRAFEKKSLSLGNLVSWIPVWTERAWKLLNRVWPSLLTIRK